MVHYEWVIEGIDEHDDIQSVNHADTLPQAKLAAVQMAKEFPQVAIGLVRDRISDYDENLEDRQWAYLQDDGTLPERFSDANGRDQAKVPPRFRRVSK